MKPGSETKIACFSDTLPLTLEYKGFSAGGAGNWRWRGWWRWRWQRWWEILDLVLLLVITDAGCCG